MAYSVADRNRAARYRKKGNLALPEEREWLRLYEESRAPSPTVSRFVAPRPLAPAPAVVKSQGAQAPPVATGDDTTAGAGARHLRLVPPADTPPPDGHVAIDFGDSTAIAHRPMAPVHSAACSIPDCPRCRAAAGAMTCAATGERVWPRMSEDGARGLAGAIMGAIVLVARMMGKDVVTDKSEVERLASALRETIYQRAGALGAGDDLYAIGWILLLVGVRVYQAPRLAK